MTTLLDTHFLVWIVTKSNRLADYPWLSKYAPWGISPVTLLEIQYLAEIGRLSVTNPEFTDRLLDDNRFVIDEIPLLALTKAALELVWTRDPFDRLISAHSAARRVPLCTVDRTIVKNHRYLLDEILRV